MSMSLTCQCGKRIAVADDAAGKKFRCPQCRELIVAPGAAAAANSSGAAAKSPDARNGDAPPQPPPKRKRRREYQNSKRLPTGWIITAACVAVVGLLIFGAVKAIQLTGEAQQRQQGRQLDEEVRTALSQMAHNLLAEQAAATLVKHHEKALPGLVEAMKESDANRRLAAAKVLRTMGPDAKPALPTLTAAINDSNAAVQVVALEALAAFGAEVQETVPSMTQLVDHQDVSVRNTALLVLGRLGPHASAAVPGLAERLRSAKSWDRQHPLLRTLGDIGPEARPAAPVVAALALQVQQDLDQVLELKKAEERKGWIPKVRTTIIRNKVVSREEYWEATAVKGPKGSPLVEYGKLHPALQFERRIVELDSQKIVVEDVLKRIDE
jgi:HEAT repeat protein